MSGRDCLTSKTSQYSNMHHSFSPRLHENHTTTAKPKPGDTDWNGNAWTCLSETAAMTEKRWWAEAASDWNVVMHKQNFIDQAIDQWRDRLNVCLKAKSKHLEHLLRIYVPNLKCLALCIPEEFVPNLTRNSSVDKIGERYAQIPITGDMVVKRYHLSPIFNCLVSFAYLISKLRLFRRIVTFYCCALLIILLT